MEGNNNKRDIDLNVLLKTSDDNLLTVFPKETYGLKRSELRNMKRKLLNPSGQPEPTTVRINQQIIIDNFADKLIKALPDIVKPVIVPPHIYKETRSKYDEETFVLILSDLQIGHKTKTYNFNIFKQRMEKMVKSILKITAIHRKSHPVKNLKIFFLGDIIQNELIGRFVDLQELEGTIKDQIFGIAIPEIIKSFGILAQNFEKMDVYCVRGNHGIVGKFNAATTNWDDVIYNFIKLSFAGTKNVSINIADNFYDIVEVEHYKFLISHGDQIKMYLNIPIYGLTQRLMRWQGSIGDFDFMVVGHFHTFAAMDWNDKCLIINGTFVTDDDWVKKVIGLSGSCCQILFSVHPRQGITFIRKIKLM